MTSLGNSRVRRDFNPGGNELVNEFKGHTAHLIDELERLKTGSDPEKGRLLSLASTAYEEACMWAVKAVTHGHEHK